MALHKRRCMSKFNLWEEVGCIRAKRQMESNLDQKAQKNIPNQSILRELTCVFPTWRNSVFETMHEDSQVPFWACICDDKHTIVLSSWNCIKFISKVKQLNDVEGDNYIQDFTGLCQTSYSFYRKKTTKVLTPFPDILLCGRCPYANHGDMLFFVRIFVSTPPCKTLYLSIYLSIYDFLPFYFPSILLGF